VRRDRCPKTPDTKMECNLIGYKLTWRSRVGLGGPWAEGGSLEVRRGLARARERWKSASVPAAYAEGRIEVCERAQLSSATPLFQMR
jgi:hypothetical protein